MAIVSLPLPPDVEARVLLHHVLEHGDVVGPNTSGRTVIQLAVNDWVLDKLIYKAGRTTSAAEAGAGDPGCGAGYAGSTPRVQ
jgi:hypothetical protein